MHTITYIKCVAGWAGFEPATSWIQSLALPTELPARELNHVNRDKILIIGLQDLSQAIACWRRSNYLENPWLGPLAFQGCSLLVESDMQGSPSPRWKRVRSAGSSNLEK